MFRRDECRAAMPGESDRDLVASQQLIDESLPGRVDYVSARTAQRLSDQEWMRTGENCWMELDELKIGDARTGTRRLEDALAVAQPAVGRALVQAGIPAGGENGRARVNSQAAGEFGSFADSVANQRVQPISACSLALNRVMRGSRSMAACTKAIKVWPL